MIDASIPSPSSTRGEGRPPPLPGLRQPPNVHFFWRRVMAYGAIRRRGVSH